MVDISREIHLLQAFDDQAWLDVEQTYAGRLLAYVARRVPDVQAREDIVQESFLGAVRGIGSFDQHFSFEQYLFGICRNRTIDHLRRRRAATVTNQEDDERPLLEQIALEHDTPSRLALDGDLRGHGRSILSRILLDWVQETWHAGEFRRMMVIEALFAGGWRNRDTWKRFDLRDETAVAGIKFRALKRLRELAAQHDPAGMVLPSLADQAHEGMTGLDVAVVWKEQHVSCPARHWIARYLAETLDDGPRSFMDFHLQEMECPWCHANRDDLAREDDLDQLLERVRASTAGLLRSKSL
ncbi:MAG: RNA polymerase sigma factor (sigma-70 family) [Planctomycetota bacterium]|jgi:RNA polymerase sigma factor (sigma-70 family)